MTSNASPQGSPAAAVVPGTLLAQKYRVERVLGRGGMGYVVEARHVALDERVALKFLLPEYAEHPEASARFQREARAAVKIKSEHVARVLDVATLENGAPYMVMEFLDGKDLAARLRDSVLSVPDAIDYVLQACEAIAEAHSLGIVHRDLKPANLFLARRPDGSPLVKLLDFGISKMQGAAGDHALTRTDTAMGSALYMSPEQMQETRGVDHRTDIYSLGITLFELIAGTQPFHADNLPQLCAEVLTGTPRPLRVFRPDLPADLAARIELAYERDKNLRYPSIADFAIALAPYAPPRSQSTLDRIARMAGLTPPLAGGAPDGEPRRMPSQPTLTSAVNPLAPPTPELSEGPSTTPLRNTGRRNSVISSTLAAATPPLEAAAQTAHKTMPLPVQIASAPETSASSPAPSVLSLASSAPLEYIEADTSRIEADLYTGPRSAHAAAAFARTTRTRPPPPTEGGRSFLFIALALGALIGILGGVLVFLFRSSMESAPTPTATGAPPALTTIPAPTLGPPLASAAPPVTPEATAPPPSGSASASPSTSPASTSVPVTPPPGAKATSKATAAPTSTTKKNANTAFNHR